MQLLQYNTLQFWNQYSLWSSVIFWLKCKCNICTILADTSQNFVEVDNYAQGLALGLGHPSACPCRGAADMWDKPYHLPMC